MASDILHIRCDDKIRERLEILAAANPGTLSDWAREALEAGLIVLEARYPTKEIKS